MKFKKPIVLVIVLAAGLIALVISRTDLDHVFGDQHDEHAPLKVHDEHDDEQEPEEEPAIELTKEQIDEIGIKLATAAGGKFDVYISLPGETVVNADRMAHIVPRVSGVVREVKKKLGDIIKAGEVIAWLESPDLGKAKIDYLGKWAEVACCALDLTRAQQIHDNTIKLLQILDSSPSLETLQEAKGIEMGDNRSKLISAYAEYSFAKGAYLREKPLFEQNISSKQDFLKAENAFKKADAQYTAVRDSIAFEVRREMLEAQRARQLQMMQLKAADRQLKILGSTNENIKELELLAQNQSLNSAEEDDCTDPNCTECAANRQASQKTALDSAQAEEKLAWYPLVAPFDGTIIRKHITLGEMVKDDSEVFVVADLSSVWVDLHVYPKDLMKIKKGQKVVMSTGQTMPDVEGVISYVGPIVGAESRTALARVVLPNTKGILRPGLFVTARVAVGEVKADVIVFKDAVQTFEGRKCVFTKDEHGFEPCFVTLGQSNGGNVQITSGLDPGQQYVTKGAFELKSRIITSTLDSHAGHGH